MKKLLLLFFAIFVFLLFTKPPAQTEVDKKQGSFLLVGGGWLSEDIRKAFLDRAGKKIVVIPTGSLFYTSSCWFDGIILHTRSRKVADTEKFIGPLKEATGVWIGGGNQQLIVDVYKGTKVERELHNLILRGGIIGGTSAGASCLSEVMVMGAGSSQGLGLLPDFIIDQHFGIRKRSARLQKLIKEHPEKVGLGIDEGVAVLLEGKKMTVFGKGIVEICTKNGSEFLRN